MPVYAPNKSGVHRVACVALYRALLQQCTHLSGASRSQAATSDHSSSADPEPQHANDGTHRFDAVLARRVLRRRFRVDARLQSPRQIVEMLKFGYESLSVLDSLDVDSPLATVAELNRQLARMDASLGRSDEGRDRSKTTANASRGASLNSTMMHEPQTPRPKASKPSVFDRPLPRGKLQGPRQVPRLISAIGVPFLRLKKPQPEVLSRLIRGKHAQKQHRLDQLMALDAGDTALTHFEDKWEELVAGLKTSARKPVSRSETRLPLVDGHSQDTHDPSYTDSIQFAKSQISGAVAAESRRASDYATRLWHIAEQERKLKYEEEGIIVPLVGKRNRGRKASPELGVSFDTGQRK